jgi:hypothetical protein
VLQNVTTAIEIRPKIAFTNRKCVFGANDFTVSAGTVVKQQSGMARGTARLAGRFSACLPQAGRKNNRPPHHMRILFNLKRRRKE